MALQSGAIFAGYRIIRPLGSGGMGEVYLAAHPRLPRRDAVKILPPDVSADPEFRERFHREADLAATLFHPNIVGVHDRGETDGQLWIAMDFVDGPDAAALIHRRYPAGMPREEALATLAAIASALDHAHSRGMLHRDVKPANILLTDGTAEQRRILLADFGIARSLTEISGLTATNMAIGTVSYAAPEQLTDDPLDGRADQYSLAATAFHLLTGSPPYPHSSPAVTIGRHLRSEPPSIGAARPDLADWDAPLRVALAKDPEQRFATCRQFVAALSGTDPDAGTAGSIAAARLPTRAAPRPQAAPPARTPPAQDPPASPARWSLVAAGTALGLLAGAVVLGAAESGSPRAAAPAPATQTTTSTQITTSTQTTTSTSTTTVTRTPAATTVTETVTAPPAPPSAAGRSSAAVADPLPASTGRWNAAANPVTTLGWRDCIRRYPWSSCLEAARVIAGAPPGSTAVLALDGVWMVPQVVGYGDYRAAVGHGGRCSWSGNDVHGRIVDSGVQAGTGTPVAVTVTPTMATVQTFGCTPWFRVAPAR